MIITKIQNYNDLYVNQPVKIKNALPVSFTSDIQLNKDIFIKSDKDNPEQQYLKSYNANSKPSNLNKTTLPRTIVHEYSFWKNELEHHRAIYDLITKNNIDESWVKKHSELLEDVFGIDFSNNPDMTKLFLSETASNNEKIAEAVQTKYERAITQFYEKHFGLNDSDNAKMADFDIEAVNYALVKLSKGENTNIPLIYRTTKPLPDLKKLAKLTNSNIKTIDDRQYGIKNLDSSLMSCFAYGETILSKDPDSYIDPKKKNIIVIKNLYQHLTDKYHISNIIRSKAETEKGIWLMENGNCLGYINSILNTLRKYYQSIIITQDYTKDPDPTSWYISYDDVPYNYGIRRKNSKIKFDDLPGYQEDKQRFIKEIVEPLKQSNYQVPKCLIINSKTSAKDTKQFITAGLNEVDSSAVRYAGTNPRHRLSMDLSNIENYDSNVTFIVVPEAYKHFCSDQVENTKALKALVNSDKKVIPVLYTDYPELLLEEINSSGEKFDCKIFTINDLTKKELENITRYFIDKADDYVNDSITKGEMTKPLDLDLNYEILAKILKYNSFSSMDTKKVIDKAVELYEKSTEKSFMECLFELITRGGHEN